MDGKTTSPWIAATACCALVFVAGMVGIAAMRTQMLMRMDSETARMRGTIGQLQNRIVALESQTAALAQVAQPDPAPVNALKADLEAKDKTIADLTTRIDTLEKKPLVVMPAPQPLAPTAMPNYTTLVNAVRSGAAFADELGEWKHYHLFKPEDVAPLDQSAATGVVTEAALRSQLQAALAGIGSTEPSDGHGIISRINAHLSGLVSIKKQGSADVYSSLRTQVGTADLAVLKRDVEALSPADRAPFAAWLDAVAVRDAAMEALTAIASAPSKSAGAP